ncbi:hypothetical protein CORC01_12692 [Colletotrichum orchidophilum]|uniref:Uncharacterized protein n=1 Tax=Colletotrichum orchidophilum TaxID=1209926 RepID=A0A1G4ASB8_9PEZI|nr:uncharacterized protein CORC01_12692 [Colletotrichum orchidophilum]OHE92001.1 hypothetical protein CORC01_12692 [Colletotrichum orchidophilum]
MSSSLARTRSLRKPTQGSSTDLPPTKTTSAPSASTTAAARGTASSTAGGGGGGAAPSASASTSNRPLSPSRLPAPRSVAATRPTTRTVSGASAASAASEAPKKKRPNPLSSLLSRSSSARQPASATTSTSTRQRDATTGGAGGGGPTSSGPTSAPLTRTSALSGLTRTSSTREPGLARTRYPANASTSNLGLASTSHAGAGAGSGSTTPTTTRPTTSGGLPATRRAAAPATSAAAAAAGSPTKGHARARSVATLNNSTVLRPLSQASSAGGAAAAPARSRPTSLYGAPPAYSYPSSSSTTSTTARPRPPSATDRLSSKPSVSSLSSATTTTSTRTARAGSTTTAPVRQPPKQPPKPPSQQQQPQTQPPHLTRQHQQRQASPTSPPRAKPVLRPAFSTLQQHYSPAKSLAPKPLTATYLAAPSPSKLPANVALTAETSRLQTELLQLHLLHRDLPQVTSQWHASARQKLAARHAELAASAKDLAALESDAVERLNVAALRSWAATGPSSSSSSSSAAAGGKASTPIIPLEDRIQRLDALLTSLWSLDSPGGKHHRLVRAFERWASTLSDLEAARARAEDSGDPSALLDDNSDVRFGGGLDARWKDEAAALVRRLEGWDAQLRELEYRGDDDNGDESDTTAAAASTTTTTTTQVSSLERMLDGCGSLVKDMLDELAVMQNIEAAAVQRENEWIKRMNREGDDGRGRDTLRAGAIWRLI